MGRQCLQSPGPAPAATGERQEEKPLPAGQQGLGESSTLGEQNLPGLSEKESAKTGICLVLCKCNHPPGNAGVELDPSL